MTEFEQLIAQVKLMKITACQWSELNYAVKLDDDSETWVSKSPDDIGDELLTQAQSVQSCLGEGSRVYEMPYMAGTLSALEALGTKGSAL